jgi:oxygen-independent coproporphyrinogen III oxidase
MVMLRPAGIYIHIPFCQSRCNYCHFVTRAMDDEVADRYRSAVLKEIHHYGGTHPTGRAIDTIYFGGGTPSIVPTEHISTMLEACSRHFQVSPDCEITLEANPGTLTRERTSRYVSAGINRVSMGAQSFADPELAAIGRVHSAADTLCSVLLLREAGLSNINLDLMAGLPGHDASQWRANLEKMVEVRPSHVSMYMLDLDEHSPLFHSVRKGILRLPEEDDVADFYLAAIEHFERSGYVQYEISNFALPGRESRHNMKYWKREPVIGFGVSSHSYDGAARYANLASLSAYLEAVGRDGSAVEWREEDDVSRSLQEALFLGLRLCRGIHWGSLREQFGAGAVSQYDETVSEMEREGLLERENGMVRLTRRGMLLSNEVFQKFV